MAAIAMVGGQSSAAVNLLCPGWHAAVCTAFPGAEGLPFDSYVSLGAGSTTSWGVLQSDAPTGLLPLGPVNTVGLLGDINVGEPKALIGFAGPRVIEQTVRETLPEGFQRSEFLLEHGAIDLIIDRRDMREKIASLLSMMQNKPAA